MDETSVAGTAVVIGAGTMGRGIAADLANAGWTVLLWDVTAEVAADAKGRLLGQRPPLLFLEEFAERILPGATEDGLTLLARADWVVEAVAESPDVKGALFARIEPFLGPKTVVTSNTSGLSLNAMARGRSEGFRRRFFGTHFLNPPRYLKLLEVIPTAETGPEVLGGFVRFAEGVLGHRVVLARDTPGFISTRLWITHLLDTIHTSVEMGVDVATVDALTGPLIGRPRSATLRMADVVGLDIIAAVATNQYNALPDDPFRERLRLPEPVERMLAEGAIGEKAGGGFYRRDGKTILSRDLSTGEYRPRADDPAPEVADLSRLPLPERLRQLRERADTPALCFLNRILDRLTEYVAEVGPEIAADVLSVDRTMQWGFGWELGPFAVADVRDSEQTHYRGQAPERVYRHFTAGWRKWAEEPEYIVLADQIAAGGLVVTDPSASLVDIGADVWCVAFHSKMNTLNPDTCAFLMECVARAGDAGKALVVGNDGQHFCAGYDLSRLVRHMRAGDWSAIDQEMDACQRAFTALKYAPVPVVAAPHGFTLGGGAEVALHCAAIQAAPELSFGLPEALVGLIPCGGGTKEVLLRLLPENDLLTAARKTLQAVARPQTSANAHDARKSGWLTDRDAVSRNADRRLYDARERARKLAEGYAPPSPATFPTVGQSGYAVLRADIESWQSGGTFTAHDARIADAIARLLSGDAPEPSVQSEQEYFDRERTLFLELCREPLTLARTAHLLETGKHLKN